MRSVLVALALLVAAPAAAQCRPASADEAALARGWSVHADDVPLGRCGAHDAWCFVVDGILCETSLRGEGDASGAMMSVAGARVLVLRWTSHWMEGTSFRSGHGTELWRVDGAPARLLSILEGWSEGDANPVRSEQRIRCAVGRELEVGADNVVLGAADPSHRCPHTPLADRRGARALGPGGRTFTWEELLAPPRRSR